MMCGLVTLLSLAMAVARADVTFDDITDTPSENVRPHVLVVGDDEWGD